MPTITPCLIHSHDPSGGPVVRLGVPLLDDYLEFLSGRCRPNTVLAVAYDLKVFFEVVGKTPKRVRPGDVLGFMTANAPASPRCHHSSNQSRTSHAGCPPVLSAAGCRASQGYSRSCTFAVTWSPILCPAGSRPAGSGNVPGKACRWCAPPGPFPAS